MIQSENLIKLIKNDTQSNLNFYKNLVQESQLDSKEIVETASRIRKAFDLENTKSKNQENPKFSFFSYKALKTQKNFTNVENTSYHTETKITPKIQIFNQRYIPKIEYLTKKSHQNVNNFNLFNNDNMIFNPSSNSFSSETTAIDKDSSKKVEQRTKIIRNDIDYDNKIKPLFFMNRYVEYSYQDKGDNLYESGDLFRHLFEKKLREIKIKKYTLLNKIQFI
jgi:hypothetical protein